MNKYKCKHNILRHILMYENEFDFKHSSTSAVPLLKGQTVPVGIWHLVFCYTVSKATLQPHDHLSDQTQL